MNDTMRAGILAVAVVLFASFAMLAVPASDAEGTEPTQMTADEFLKGLSDGKLVMDKDVELTSALNIATEMELDLAGHKLVNNASTNANNTITVGNGGKLTVKDSIGGGIVDNVTHAKAALHVDAGAEAILNGGTFERSLEAGDGPSDQGGTNGKNSWYTIANRGTITINDGVTVLNGDAKTTGRYSSMIGNGYPSAGDNKDGHDVVLTINGGRFVGGLYNIKNDDYGVLTIKGGTFAASSGLCNILNWNDLTIKGGQFSSDVGIINAWDTSATYNRGIINISSGTFDCPDRIVYLGMESNSTYTLDMAFDGLKEGRSVLKTATGIIMNGTISVNKNAVELKSITAGAGFAMSVGSIDIEGAYTSAADGSITVNGDAKLSGTIDSSVTVKVASGSITVPEGKTLTGTIQMKDSSVTLTGITAGKDGLTVTPSAIGGAAKATSSGSIAITGAVSVTSSLTLDKVELSVPAGSTLNVSKDAAVTGGSIENAGTVNVAGSVESTIDNADGAKVSATVDAKVSEVTGDGEFTQPKPVIQEIDAKRIALGGSINIYVSVTEGADVELSGVSWAVYKDGCITGTPDKAGQFTIIATPSINGNVGESVSFRVIVDAPSPVVPDDSEDEKEKDKEKGGTSIAVILAVVIVVLLLILVATRFI